MSTSDASAGRASMFWRHAFAIRGSITPHVLPNVAIMGAFATITCLMSWIFSKYLLGKSAVEQMESADHMPSAIIGTLAQMLQQARDEQGMTQGSFVSEAKVQ